MREIKFRAWLIEREQMVDVEKIDFFGNAVWFIDEETNKMDVVMDDFILMQCTGLRDKYGKEIYEGDIIKIKGDKRIYIVRYGVFEAGEGGYFVKGWYLEENDELPLRFSILAFEQEELEIIGNIYENPDLVKKEFKRR